MFKKIKLIILVFTISALVIFTGCNMPEEEQVSEDLDKVDSTKSGGSYVIDAGMEYYASYAVTDDVWDMVDLHRSYLEIALVDIQTSEGMNTCGPRLKFTGGPLMNLHVEEEKSRDNEIYHVDETFGILLIDETDPYITDRNGNRMGHLFQIEAGQGSTTDLTFHQILIGDHIKDPVVFSTIVTENGSHPCHMRIGNIEANDMENRHFWDWKIEEWEYLDARHTEETIHWVVVNKGAHEMYCKGKDVVWEAGTIDVTAQTWNSNITVNTETNFKADTYPFIFTRCQTYNDQTPVVIRNTQMTSSSGSGPKNMFTIRLQEEEANDQYHGAETIGYLIVGEAD
jgi:hypothetical protein